MILQGLVVDIARQARGPVSVTLNSLNILRICRPENAEADGNSQASHHTGDCLGKWQSNCVESGTCRKRIACFSSPFSVSHTHFERSAED